MTEKLPKNIPVHQMFSSEAALTSQFCASTHGTEKTGTFTKGEGDQKPILVSYLECDLCKFKFFPDTQSIEPNSSEVAAAEV